MQIKMGKIHLVTCKKGAENAVQHIMLGEPIVGLACTGVTVGPKGMCMLVKYSHLNDNTSGTLVQGLPNIPRHFTMKTVSTKSTLITILL